MKEFSLINDLASVPDHSYVSVVMRHSDRYPIESPDEVFKVGLTPLGVRRAEDFGKVLSEIYPSCGALISTPVGRCVDTANAISRGAGWHKTAATDRVVSFQYIENIYNILLSQDTQHFSVLPDEIRNILSRITTHDSKETGLDLYVTHDSVIACILGYLTGERFTEENWVEFLEGFLVWKKDGHAALRWRNRLYEIELPE